jgi:GNAT superfamily N-acetyltransferase
VISPATSADAAGATGLLRAAFPGELFTEAGTRYRIEQPEPDARRALWKAEVESEIVGWAAASLDPFSAEPGRAFVGLAVHPKARGKGLGTALWEVIAEHLDEIEARTTSIATRDDDVSARFAERRGFAHSSTDTLLVTDPRTIEPTTAPAGVEIVPLETLADDLEAIYSCEAETTQDEPGPFDTSAMTFERWRRHIWDHPDVDWELSMAAVADRVVVGTTFLSADRETGLGANSGTGVRRAFRGRGLGLALKRASLGRAVAAGITTVVTHNDDTNAPMLAINRRLGYRPLATGRWWLRESPGTSREG